MRRYVITAIALLAFAPAAAAAIVYEDGYTFAHYGRFEVIVREAGDTPGIEGPHIEIECAPTLPDGYAGPYVPSVHPIGSADDARRLANILWDAADAAEE